MFAVSRNRSESLSMSSGEIKFPNSSYCEDRGAITSDSLADEILALLLLTLGSLCEVEELFGLESWRVGGLLEDVFIKLMLYPVELLFANDWL